jgi:hypothetical protein
MDLHVSVGVMRDQLKRRSIQDIARPERRNFAFDGNLR